MELNIRVLYISSLSTSFTRVYCSTSKTIKFYIGKIKTQQSNINSRVKHFIQSEKRPILIYV